MVGKQFDMVVAIVAEVHQAEEYFIHPHFEQLYRDVSERHVDEFPDPRFEPALSLRNRLVPAVGSRAGEFNVRTYMVAVMVEPMEYGVPTLSLSKIW
jgi:hypothetical protein